MVQDSPAEVFPIKRRSVPTIIIVLLIFIVIWIASLIKCEILTNLYYDDFALAYSNNTMLGPMVYFKVLRCDDETAQVYYVSGSMTSASVLTFEKRDDIWVETSWEPIWSTTGSASEVIYPYWWHFIYGGI